MLKKYSNSCNFSILNWNLQFSENTHMYASFWCSNIFHIIIIYQSGEKKKKKEHERKFCPYGCGKSWKASSINNNSVRAHLLGGGRTKCPNFPTNEKTLLKQFYTKKRRSSFADYISWDWNLLSALIFVF